MTNCLIVGVGGQGTVLASKLLAAAAMDSGFFVRTTETIGMAQRGGSVVSHVRIGRDISSPLIPPGEADIIIAFEPAEAVRALPYLKASGAVVVCDTPVYPVGGSIYDVGGVIQYLRAAVENTVVVDGARLTALCGAKTLNIAMLGAAACRGVFPFSAATIKQTLEKVLPGRFLKMNLDAFDIGGRMLDETAEQN